MKNLYLLLSASALSTIPLAAYSADNPVVAEPETAEYVRICDIYGAGYFYIPGTETCLRVGGFIRYEVRAGEGPYGGHNDVADKSGGTDDTYHVQGRFSLRTWTRQICGKRSAGRGTNCSAIPPTPIVMRSAPVKAASPWAGAACRTAMVQRRM